MLTPTQTAQEFELLVDCVVRGRSHSHALSAILGAHPRTSASTSFDWRTSSQAQLNPTSSQTQLNPTSSQSRTPETEKTDFPWLLTQWKPWRRRGKRVGVWLVATLVFVASFLLLFAFPTQMATLAPLGLGSLLTLVSTFVVLVSFLKRWRLQRRPNELLAFVALSEFCLATLTLTHMVIMCSATDGRCRSLSMVPCTVAVTLDLFLLLTGIGWFGAAILHLFVAISNPFASYKRQLVLYHLVVWTFSLLASAIVAMILFSEHTQTMYQLSEIEVCRMVALVLPLLPRDANESLANKRRRLSHWQDLNVAFYGVLAATVVLIIVAAQLSLVVGWWRSNSGTIIALKARRRLLKRMTIYVHALSGMWFVLVAVFFIYRATPRALEYLQVEGTRVPLVEGMNVWHACFHFLVTGKGFVTAVVWFSVNKPCCVLELLCCGWHRCHHDDKDLSLDHSASQSPSTSESYTRNVHGLRDDQTTLLCTTCVPHEPGQVVHETPMLSPSSTVSNYGLEHGPESCLGRPQDPSLVPTLSSVFDPMATARSSRFSSSNEASTVESYEASRQNETLQREIIYYTVCGITKAILRAAERASVATPSTPVQANGTPRERDNGLVETTLVVGEPDSLVNSSLISHVQSVPMQLSPRRYCLPRVPLSVAQRHSLDALDDDTLRTRPTITRPTSFTSASTVDAARIPGHRLSHASARRSSLVYNATRSFTGQSPGRRSLYPVSQVPFELFEQEIELQSTRSSSDEPVDGHSTRSAVFAGLRRTATSALSQGRGVFRTRSGSADPTATPLSVPVLDDAKPKVFVDYAPRAFRAIRSAFHLSDAKYLASFRTTAKERVSAGASGAFMFFSGDNALLVKSLKEKECRALVAMAPLYAQYVTAHPHSRLIRFFGCHRIRLYGRNFYFAVMSNVLHSEGHTTAIAEKYDLKGSWVNRRARRPQRGDRVTCAECDASYLLEAGDEPGDGWQAVSPHAVPPFHVHRPDIVLKDLDLTRTLQLPRTVARHLHAQLVADCEFLRDLGIMDYSLLIGIHKCHVRPSCGRRASGSSEAEASTQWVDEGTSGVNLAPLGETEVYFIGIIDILQQWDWEKQFEKAGKVLLGKCGRGISAVAPAVYCRRFQARCTQILLGGPPPEELDLHWGDGEACVGNVKEMELRRDKT